MKMIFVLLMFYYGTGFSPDYEIHEIGWYSTLEQCHEMRAVNRRLMEPTMKRFWLVCVRRQ